MKSVNHLSLTVTAFLFATAVNASSQPLTISTLAGLGGSYGSANGDGNNARFRWPTGVAVDSADNVYVADANNHSIRKITPDGTVTTFAGLAENSGSGDGAGSDARFYYPRAVSVDKAGNVYVADESNYTIRKITPGGTVSTLAGLAGSRDTNDGVGVNARFYLPRGIAVDNAGNVLVADQGNYTIRKITPERTVSTLAGHGGASGTANGTGSNARFAGPEGLAVDADGNVHVGDWNNDNIRKITTNGVVSTLAGGREGSLDGTGTDARFHDPTGVAVDTASNVYVTDTVNHTIRKITAEGVVSTLTGLAGNGGGVDGSNGVARLSYPRGVAFDSAGNLLVADSNNDTIRKVTPDGVVSTLAGLSGGSADGAGSNARFFFPESIAVDSAGNLFVADTGNHTIRKITSDGVVGTFAGLAGTSGSADGLGGTARFINPSGVASDSAGNVFVADTSNHTIRKITPEGLVTTLAGLAESKGSANGSSNIARFLFPKGVGVDNAGVVYVADTVNHTLRKISPTGDVSTLAGLAGSSGSTNGTGDAARFNNPTSVAVDGAGNIYVADYGNFTIRKVTPAGVVSTVAGLAGSYGTTDGSGSVARFCSPSGVAADRAGNIYVADYCNGTIRHVTPAGEVSTLAGLAGTTGTTDGAGSDARFYYPKGVAVDSAGIVYVADTWNHTIRVGRATSVPPPTLQITRSVNMVILSWPASATNFFLEASEMVLPGISWSLVTGGVATVGDRFVLTNDVNAADMFYRLRQP